MDPNLPQDEEPQHVKQTNRMKIVVPIAIIIAAMAIFLYMKMNDGPSKSQVADVSDEVYEELVQWYFYTVTFMEEFVKYYEDGTKVDVLWFEDHELYKVAEEYADAHDHILRAIEVFPNPLILNYFRQPDQYTNTEQKYIKKMYDFINAFQRINVEEYETLKEELKKELHIKNSYNPFNK